jgi:hypothetical protein
MEKRKFKIKLHTQIVIGLILGVLFGSYFHIDQKRVEIKSKSGSVEVNDWTSFQFLKKDSVIKSFNADDQLIILKYFNGIKDRKFKKRVKDKRFRNLKRIYRCLRTSKKLLK